MYWFILPSFILSAIVRRRAHTARMQKQQIKRHACAWRDEHDATHLSKGRHTRPPGTILPLKHSAISSPTLDPRCIVPLAQNLREGGEAREHTTTTSTSLQVGHRIGNGLDSVGPALRGSVDDIYVHVFDDQPCYPVMQAPRSLLTL